MMARLLAVALLVAQGIRLEGGQMPRGPESRRNATLWGFHPRKKHAKHYHKEPCIYIYVFIYIYIFLYQIYTMIMQNIKK